MDYLEIAGTIVGLLYLWLEYRASIYLWAASIIMPAIYIFVYYNAGLYADMGINGYFLLASIYGWLAWIRGSQKTEQADLSIRHTPIHTIFPLFIIFLVAFFVIAWILVAYTNSDVPYLDSFTTALSIIAMWLLARKYIEQWLVWIVVDVVSCGLYIYKGLGFTAALYGIYTIIAIFGYFKWKRMMNLTTVTA